MKLLITFLVSIFLNVSLYAIEIIAHRGYWDKEGSVQNSVSSLKNAHEAGFYGSEMDVYITTDDVVIVNHDASLWGMNIETRKWDDVKQTRLPNGEKLPTFEEYLKAHKEFGGATKMIIEVKPQDEEKNDVRLVNETLALVKKYGLEEKVDYVSFGLEICKMIVKNTPKGTVVLYLSGDMSPKELHKHGITGFDYLAEAIMLNPGWIKQAKKLGMITALWTVNDKEKMQWCIDNGIDFVTTDKPVLLKQLIEESAQKKTKK